MANILGVEDHPLFVQSLVRLLRDRGNHEVMAVSSGEQALEHVLDRDFQLVMIDVSLPGMSGIELLTEVAAKKPGLPCLMVSGHMASQYVNQSMRRGARGYVLKEDIPGILEAITHILQGETYISE